MPNNKSEVKWWIDRYPFLRIEDVDDGCWLDSLPQGWVDTFGEQMCDDLMEALGDYAREWEIIQVKEKYGAMRLYHNGCPKEISNNVESIIDKYSYISQFVCTLCGSIDAQLYDDGWVQPWCDKCFEEIVLDRYGKFGLDKDKFKVYGKFDPIYEIRRFADGCITTVIVDVSNEWERLKNCLK